MGLYINDNNYRQGKTLIETILDNLIESTNTNRDLHKQIYDITNDVFELRKLIFGITPSGNRVENEENVPYEYVDDDSSIDYYHKQASRNLRRSEYWKYIAEIYAREIQRFTGKEIKLVEPSDEWLERD